jgi:environmental stress-induced protein Ves
MSVSSIAPTEWRSQSWKNGKGVTHEVWRTPDQAEYDVRVSVADDVSPAPFSKFPGYHRWSVLIGRAPITLLIDGKARELVKIGDVVDHDGDADVESISLPSGPTKLLNVLAKPGWRVGVGTMTEPVRFAFVLDGIAEQRWHSFDYHGKPAPPPAGMVVWVATPP